MAYDNVDMSFLRLRVGLRAVRDSLSELRSAIERHSEAIHAADRIQNSIRWAAWFGFGAAVIYAGISLLVWRQMIKQNRIANSTLRQSIASFRTDERAWIEFEPIKPIMVSPQSRKFPAAFKYDIYAKNIGKTEALDVRFRYATQMFGNEHNGDNPDFAKSIQDELLFHREKGSTGVPIGSPPVPSVLPPNTTATTPFIAAGQSPRNGFVEFIVGRVDYVDAFGIAHWKKFCFYTADAKGTLWYCKYGNSEDKNPELPPN